MKREFDERETQKKGGSVGVVLPIELYIGNPFQEKYTGTRNEPIGHYPIDIYRVVVGSLRHKKGREGMEPFSESVNLRHTKMTCQVKCFCRRKSTQSQCCAYFQKKPSPLFNSEFVSGA